MPGPCVAAVAEARESNPPILIAVVLALWLTSQEIIDGLIVFVSHGVRKARNEIIQSVCGYVEMVGKERAFEQIARCRWVHRLDLFNLRNQGLRFRITFETEKSNCSH